MILPICERGKKCIYLEKRKEKFEVPLFARSEKTVGIEKLSYYCKNKKTLKYFEVERKLTHEEKFKSCGFKVTNRIDEYATTK